MLDTLYITVVKLCLFVSGFTQFLARDVQDTFPQLVDNGLRMLLQLLTSWKNALTPNSLRGSKDATGADGTRGGNRDVQAARKTEHVQVSAEFCKSLQLLRFCAFVSLKIVHVHLSYVLSFYIHYVSIVLIKSYHETRYFKFGYVFFLLVKM